MNNLSLAIEIRDYLYLEKLNQESDCKDYINAKIDERAEQLMQNFNNQRDYQIIKQINKLIGGNVDYDIYNQFITDICYSQARYEFNSKKNISSFGCDY